MKRYKTGENPVYDEHYVRVKNMSDILSPHNVAPSVNTILFDINNLKGMRLRYIGDSKGKFIQYGEQFTAIIPSDKQRLAELEQKFQDYCDQKEQEGYPRPDEYPWEMANKRSILEATLDISLEELKKIEERIKDYEDKITVEANGRILKWGLECTAQLRKGLVAEIDGQKVVQLKNGLLVISEPLSPYHGMAVSDYRAMAADWREKITLADREKLKQMQASARANGNTVPKSYSSIPAGSVVKREKLPPFPANVKNHFAE